MHKQSTLSQVAVSENEPIQPYPGLTKVTKNPPSSNSLPTNPNKSLPSNTTHTLQIKLLNHSPKLLLLKPRLAQLPRNTSQVLKVNKPLSTLVEQLERAQDLVPRVPLEDLQRRNGLERRERHEQVRRVLRVRHRAFV